MLNKYSRLRMKVTSLVEDIAFLRECRRKNTLPNFIKIKAAVENYRSIAAVKKAEKTWLSLEIKHKYKELSDTEIELYNLHLFLTKNLNNSEYSEWSEFDQMVNSQCLAWRKRKQTTHSHKVSVLCENNPQIVCEPHFISDFVINESDESFSSEELDLLNKGLKFTPAPTKLPLLDTIVDIETVLKYKVPSTQNDIRTKTVDILDTKNETNTTKTAIDHARVIDSLKKKDVVYVKADKSNNLVILNKNDYDQRVEQLITECNYTEVKRNPLKKMIRETNALRQKIKQVFSDRVCRALIVSNPTLPKLYALPKTHKIGNKMRPIVSNINAPTYKLAKWLVSEIKKLPQLESLSVKNSFEFVEKIKDLELSENEMMVSFDVASLFPSIPVDVTLSVLGKHLETLELDQNKKVLFLETAKLCMDQSFFQFREKLLKSSSAQAWAIHLAH